MCQKFGLGIIPWSPLGGGMLTGKYKRGEEPGEGTRFGAAGPVPGDLAAGASCATATTRSWRWSSAEAEQLGVSPIALSLAWNLARPGVVAPIIGPKSVQQLEDNLAALDVTLPAETMERIDDASEPASGVPARLPDDGRQMMQAMQAGVTG